MLSRASVDLTDVGSESVQGCVGVNLCRKLLSSANVDRRFYVSRPLTSEVPMLHVGLDIHTKHMSICVLNETGQCIHRSRVRSIDQMVTVLEGLQDRFEV